MNQGAAKQGLLSYGETNQYAIAIRTYAMIAPALAACGYENTGSGQSEF
jgi:hypothetical protein